MRALVASYTALPVNELFAAEIGLVGVADTFSGTFILALQLGSPFIVYALIVNLAIGFANKLMPQIPVYFISHALRARRRAAAALFHHRRGFASVHRRFYRLVEQRVMRHEEEAGR